LSFIKAATILAGKDDEEEESVSTTANCFYKVLTMYGSLSTHGFDKCKTDHKLLQVWYSTFKSKNNTSTKKLNKLFQNIIEKYQDERSLSWNNKLVGPVINKDFLGLTRKVSFITEALTKQMLATSEDEIYIFNFALFDVHGHDYQSAIENCQKDNRDKATGTPKEQRSKVDSKSTCQLQG
jgi:hypothetical protein